MLEVSGHNIICGVPTHSHQTPQLKPCPCVSPTAVVVQGKTGRVVCKASKTDHNLVITALFDRCTQL